MHFLQKYANFVRCCQCDFSELLDVDFKLYFDAHIATEVTLMLYCECCVNCILLLWSLRIHDPFHVLGLLVIAHDIGTISLCVTQLFSFICQLFTSDKGGGKCFCPCLFVCLLARLLKNACMDLGEMLHVDRCQDMDELINF